MSWYSVIFYSSHRNGILILPYLTCWRKKIAVAVVCFVLRERPDWPQVGRHSVSCTGNTKVGLCLGWGYFRRVNGEEMARIPCHCPQMCCLWILAFYRPCDSFARWRNKKPQWLASGPSSWPAGLSLLICPFVEALHGRILGATREANSKAHFPNCSLALPAASNAHYAAPGPTRLNFFHA